MESLLDSESRKMKVAVSCIPSSANYFRHVDVAMSTVVVISVSVKYNAQLKSGKENFLN